MNDDHINNLDAEAEQFAGQDHEPKEKKQAKRGKRKKSPKKSKGKRKSRKKSGGRKQPKAKRGRPKKADLIATLQLPAPYPWDWSPGFKPVHIQGRLNAKHGEILKRIEEMLRSKHAQLQPSGIERARHVENRVDAIRWILENIEMPK